MILLDEYDIQEAFAAIEEELIKSMMRNMKRHRVEEVTEGMEWTMWQAEQLKALELYKKHNQKAFNKQFGYINNQIDKLLNQARQQGNMDAEIEILEAIKNGFKAPRRLSKSVQTSAEFFRLNDRKLNALIKATMQDFQKAEIAMLRMANDQYRKIIFNAHVYANAGAATYEQAVDMASKDFLSAGINCIEYKNGARVNIASYTAMAIQTASKRAYLAGEGEKRKEWGIATVIMNKRGAACPKCLPFVGKVLIDDVWSGGEAWINGKQRNNRPTQGLDGSSGKAYQLMSYAISKGLYHPRCKDSHITYFEGITTPPKPMTQADLDRIADKYRQEQKQKYNERMVQKYKILSENTLDADNKLKYEAKYKEWKMRSKFFKGETVKPIAKAVPDGIINNKEWLKAEFSSKKRYKTHIEKHLHEYGDILEERYIDKARELLSTDLSEDVEGFVDNEGFIFKYRKSTNDFAIGRADGKISTLFKPVDGIKYWEGERIKYEPRN